MLLFVLWYCYKRGREVRLEKDAAAMVAAPADGIEGSTTVPEVATRSKGKGKAV